MKKFDDIFEKKLEQTISSLEEKTSAEIVVVIAPSSDYYNDACYKGGLILAFIILIYLLFTPLYFAEIFVPIIILLAFILGASIIRFIPSIKRLLIASHRKELQVNRAAYSYFMENDLSETSGRTALLVYISLLEKKISLIPDKGIENSIPQGKWLEVEANFQELFQNNSNLPQTILDKLTDLSSTLSEFLPPSANNINELPNNLGRI